MDNNMGWVAFAGGVKHTWIQFWNWCQHDFASWIVNTWVLILLWLIAINAVRIGMIWDREFASTLAPGLHLIESYKGAGITISLAAIMMLSFSVLAWRKDAKVTAGLSALFFLGIGATTYLHSIGVQSERIQAKFAEIEAPLVTERKSVESKDAVLEELRSQRTRLQEERQDILDQNSASIQIVGNDPIAGVNAGDRETIERLSASERTEAKDAEIKNIDDQILAALSDTSAEETIQEAEINKAAFSSLTVMMARWLHGKDATTDETIRIETIFSVFWAAQIPLLGFLVPMLTNYHMHMQEKRQGAPGTIVKMFTPEEWAEWEKAKRHRENFERGQEERRTKNILKIDNEEWRAEIRKQVKPLIERQATLYELEDLLGYSPAEVMNILKRTFTHDEIAYLLDEEQTDGPAQASDRMAAE